jgi:thermolabile hemolysin
MKKVAWLVFWFAGCILQISSVAAFNLNDFQNLVIFGDSLSDNGNSYFLTAGQDPPDPPYYQGRWTNGPNWVDYFPLIADFPSVAGQPEAITPFFANPDTGTNVAVGGSTSFPVTGSSSTSPTSLAVQIGAFVAQHGGRIPGNDLYMIWIGANDFPGGITDPKVTIAAIGAGIAQLRQAGATSIAVVNVPDISLTPRLRAEGGATVQAAKNFVTAVNIGLQVEAPLLAWSLRVQLQLIDVNALFTQLVYHPGRFGFTNSSGYALDPNTGGGDTNQNDYVFFDGFHPTTPVHCIAAEYFYEVLTNGAAYPAGRLVLYP